MKKEEMKQQMNSGIKPGEDYAPHPGYGMGGMGGGPRLPPKPIEEITCFKCGNKGHYANKCPKGHLAFLSHNVPQNNVNPHHQNQNPPGVPYRKS